MGLRVTHKRDRASRKPVVAKAANGFDFAVTHLGDSKWVGADGKPVGVWYDPNDSNSQAMAADVLIKIDDLMTYCDSVFGVKGKSGNVIITSQVGGGAYHFGCSFNADAPGSDWYETNEGTVGSSLIYFGLVMAEVSESYMGLQAKGWNCGGSGGEGLSRVLAEIVSGGSNGAMGASGYAAGPSYDGTDWISADQGSDRDYPSTGCAVLYCWWMMSQGFTIQQIVQAGESDGTLASNYSKLTGLPATQAFTNFQVAVSKVGGPGAFSVDNPFHAPEQPYPTGVPVPPGPPVPPTPPPSTGNTLVLVNSLPAGTYAVGGTGSGVTPEQVQAAISGIESALSALAGVQDSVDDLSDSALTFYNDTRVIGKVAEAFAQSSDYAKIAVHWDAHVFLMACLHRRLHRSQRGRDLLATYSVGALPTGWLTNFLDWVLKNGPAVTRIQIIAFIQQIMKLFGL